MDYATLDTVEKIAKFTKQKVNIFTQYPSKKEDMAQVLGPIFRDNADGWKLVVNAGEFRSGFSRVLGKNGMKNLKKILYVIDIAKWRDYFRNGDDE